MERRYGVREYIEREREMRSRPGLRGHPCRFMPRAFVCTRDEIGGIWFDDLVWPPLGGDVPENE